MSFSEAELEWVPGESRLLILTGAGISAESGISTFRDSNGLWENHPIEEVATPEGFERDAAKVIKFYNDRRAQLKSCNPNFAHQSIAKLQTLIQKRCYLITQNVDDLHERGGSNQVLHMHGELNKLRCLGPEEHVIDFFEDQSIDQPCPHCGSRMRPHIVWFGEIPFDMPLISTMLKKCTHFLYIGTSSQVYPAAGFREYAYSMGAKVISINPEIRTDPYTHLCLKEKAGTACPRLLGMILESESD
jgi:NAD-dependent deacetylase